MTYSLFHHQRMLNFFCAVRQDNPVPLFIRAPTWGYAGAIAPDTLCPPGFDEEAALFACRFQGFYAFRAQSRWKKLMGLAPDTQGPHDATDQRISSLCASRGTDVGTRRPPVGDASDWLKPSC